MVCSRDDLALYSPSPPGYHTSARGEKAINIDCGAGTGIANEAPMDLPWEEVWQELQNNLKLQPPCDEHPEYRCIYTLKQDVPNDIMRVGDDGVLIRSHSTMQEDFIKVEVFRTWWEHLRNHRTASLVEGDPNNPERWRSRVVGAIWFRCLPWIGWAPATNEIKLLDLKRQALQAFLRDLPQLYAQRPGQWVAYHGERQVAFADQKHLLYQECFDQGLPDEEFVIFCIEPQETETWLGVDTLD
jgi:hypothetical protein